MTEFIGYISLGELKSSGAFFEDKSITMATYMLCGFANFASIGIQIGGIGSNKKKVTIRTWYESTLGWYIGFFIISNNCWNDFLIYR